MTACTCSWAWTTVAFLIGFCYTSQAVKLKLSDYTWQKPQLPDLAPVAEIRSGHAEFQGHVRSMLRVDCDLDCQVRKDEQSLSLEEIENDLSYETLDVSRQIRIKTVVNVSNVPLEMLRLDGRKANGRLVEKANTPESTTSSLSRRRRAVFGFDTRYSLATNKYSTMFPFSTAVKLSTGCAGVLVSPKHVLTSAHCIHNGKKYLKGVKKLRIGRFMERKIKKKPKRKLRKLKKKKIKKTKKSRVKKPRKVKSKTLVRSRRSISKLPPKFKWIRAKKTHIPQSWLQQKGQKKSDLMVEFDYAVIELKKPIGTQHMKIGISPVKEHLPRNQRIHFTAFNPGKDRKLLYRNCAVEEQSSELMYHYCDAQKGTTGAGIYIRLYDRATSSWDRRVVGVFSGHQWVDMGENAPPKEYNTGVRITPLKYAQICFWTTGNYSQCQSD